MKRLVLIVSLVSLLSGIRPLVSAQEDSRPSITPANVTQLERISALDMLSVRAMAWSPDGKSLAVVSMGDLNLYDMTQPDAAPRVLSDLATESAVASSPDGTRLAIGGTPLPDQIDTTMVLDTEGTILFILKVARQTDTASHAVPKPLDRRR